MPTGLMADAPPSRIPATPDLDRMRAERGRRLRAAMRDQGIDVLVLLGNTNVVYATGAVWPLADAGRANFEQPVAVVLADDEWREQNTNWLAPYLRVASARPTDRRGRSMARR